jgi:type I restriction-modification system DNA methylase subunit
MTKEQAKATIDKLVERFEEHRKEYHLPDYNEQKARQDFINPFFKALGCDIDNEKGASEAYREVIYEDKVVVRGKAKAPDYGFRLAGSGKKRLFFVEAKKPSVVLKTNKESAYQLKRYGSSAQAHVSILTNFEDFIVYDCSRVPNLNDSASVARLKHIHFQDYGKEFDFIYDTFSHEAVTKGRFDKFVQSDANKKGTDTLDKRFVKSLDEWRLYLAKSIAFNNRKLNDEEINFSVQQTLDRLIFMRFCEDRAVEPDAQLQKAVSKGDSYKNLVDLFKQADDKYNSGLFDFKKDVITPKLKIDNKVLKIIINELYFPLCNFDFRVMPVEVLGNAYEQFLGKVIRTTPARSVKIEEKPEVRKAGGVFYTPQYIVEYIVKNTVGKLIDGKSPKEIEKIKIVDPACGSGSFLVGAFEYLLNHHVNYYHKKGYATRKGKDNPFTTQGTLTTHEKKRILINNIFGVDIDANAVEVTKLSLLLKCMEGETAASIQHQMSLFHERVLPNIDNNIKDGNSLIDTDIYDSEIDLGYEKKIKPFSWKKGFPEVFKQGGFDVVIGNPPYVMLQNLETREAFDYCLKKFQSAKYKIDTYQLFTEQSLKLINDKGVLGFITPNTFLKNIHAEPLRKFILNNAIINEILLFKYPVFVDASVDTCVFVFEKGKSSSKNELSVKQSEISFEIKELSSVKQADFIKNNRTDFNLLISGKDSEILNKINKVSEPLETFCDAYFGIQTFDRETFVSTKKINKNYEPVIDGGNIEPYYLKPSTDYVNYIPSSIKSGGNESIYRQNRVCIRQIGAYPIATFVPAGIFTLNTIYNVYLKEKDAANLKFILGIINSSTIQFFWKKNNSDEKKTFPKIKKEAILSIPIPMVKKDVKRKQSHDEIIKNVEFLLKLNEEIRAEKLQTKIEQLKLRIEHSEEKINQLVYELYDLTEKEIAIIENAGKN